jgi:hypothetical protein
MLNRPTPTPRPPARTWTHPEENDAAPHDNPTPRVDGLSPRPRHPIASHRLRIGLNLPAALSSIPPPHYRTGPLQRLNPLLCMVNRLNFARAAFNPHLATALAPYCKSPYPHRSAHAASEHEKFCPRSTVDTALEIYRQLTGKGGGHRRSPILPMILIGMRSA